MSEIPIVTLEEVRQHGVHPIALVKHCREKIQDIFALLSPGFPTATERLLVDKHSDERLDSATMIYCTELKVEWVDSNRSLRVEALDDDIHNSPRKLTFNADFKSKSVAFSVECHAPIRTDYLEIFGIVCALDMRKANVHTRGLDRVRLEALFKLLLLPTSLLETIVE